MSKTGIAALIVVPLLAIGVAIFVIVWKSPATEPKPQSDSVPIAAAPSSSSPTPKQIEPVVAPAQLSPSPVTVVPPPKVSPISTPPKKTPHYQGKSPAEWAEALQDKDAVTRRSAAIALATIGTDADPVEVVPALTDGLDDEYWDIRAICAETLIKFKKEPRIVPSMIKVLQNSTKFPDWTAAANALGGMGSDAADAIPALQACRDRAMQGERLDDPATPPSSPFLIATKAIDAALQNIRGK